MELPWRYNYSTLTALVTSGSLQASQLVTSTARILEQKYRFHADKTNGYGLEDAVHDVRLRTRRASRRTIRPIRRIGMSHIALAEQAAEESMVLLKNDNNTLPINRTTVQEDRGHRRQRQLHAAGDEQPGQCTATAATLQLHDRLHDRTCAPATTDRAASSPIRRRASARSPASWPPRQRHHREQLQQRRRARQTAGFDVAIVIAGLTPQDEGEEYTGAGDRTTGGTSATTHT